MNTIHTAPSKFINLIKDIATAYQFDLSLRHACLHLSKESDENLTIKKLDHKIITIGQYRQIGGLISPAPEIEFLEEGLIETDSDEHKYWTPVRVVQGASFTQVAWTNSDGVIIDVKPQGLVEAAVLCNSWADRINRQYWAIDKDPAPGVTATFQYLSEELRGIKISNH